VAAARQLTLDWDHAPSYAREDFLVAPSNAEALRAIDGWRHWPGGLQALLGPAGAGKTHLGAIWSREADALVVTGREIGSVDLARLEATPRLFIDDADHVGEAEAELFHALNAVRERGGATLFAARRPPDLWGLKTADLLSRLRLAPLADLHAPDIDLMRAVLFKLFADRQIAVDATLVAYLAPRLERSIAAARAAVETLDREAMAQGRKLTRALAAQALRLDASEED
jgi:chromosomal replication initiation ATPase DnaA